MNQQRKLLKNLTPDYLHDTNKSFDLPSSICFRVTRYCNAHCSFCLAPPDGAHPDVETLIRRLDWLLLHGVETIHFCGGEPTIHPGLPVLLEHVNAKGGKIKLTTNGITLSDELLKILHATGSQVKVSLHGNREHHDAIVGRKAFEHTTCNIGRLVRAGVRTSVQTTVVAGAQEVVEWVAGFCLETKVRRLSIMPFIPRGNGLTRREDYELSSIQRRSLRELVAKKRRAFTGRLDLRWLDFSASPLLVAEADGRVILESSTEARDVLIYQIP